MGAVELVVREAGGAELDVAARLAAGERGGAEEGWRERFGADRDDADACSWSRCWAAARVARRGGGLRAGAVLRARPDAPAQHGSGRVLPDRGAWWLRPTGGWGWVSS